MHLEKGGDNGTAHLKYVNNCLNTNIYSFLETSGGPSSNLYLNAVHFFNTRVQSLDICGSLRQLFSCIGVIHSILHNQQTSYSVFIHCPMEEDQL